LKQALAELGQEEPRGRNSPHARRCMGRSHQIPRTVGTRRPMITSRTTPTLTRTSRPTKELPWWGSARSEDPSPAPRAARTRVTHQPITIQMCSSGCSICPGTRTSQMPNGGTLAVYASVALW